MADRYTPDIQGAGTALKNGMQDHPNETGLFGNQSEKKLHDASIEQLSRHLEEPHECVRRLYWLVLSRLKKQARVEDFLPVLVSRRVTYLLGIRRAKRSGRITGQHL